MSIQGEGLWDDMSQQITMMVSHEFPEHAGGISFVFNGYQIARRQPVDEAGNVLWTLTGTYQAIPFKLPFAGIDPNMEVPIETSRRQIFGWYAQITEIK